MDILDDRGVRKLSAKVGLKANYSFKAMPTQIKHKHTKIVHFSTNIHIYYKMPRNSKNKNRDGGQVEGLSAREPS